MDDLGYWQVVYSNWRDWDVASDVQRSSPGVRMAQSSGGGSSCACASGSELSLKVCVTFDDARLFGRLVQ